MTAYLEDLRPGSGYLSAARTIRKRDITAFACSRCLARDVTGSCQSSVETRP